MSFKSSFKGLMGEAIINFSTWLLLDKNIYHRINNLTLPLPDGGSTQIDHVIVSKYGIFVIETKNYKGWIFGDENQAQWTQVLHQQKYRFQNPLRQNYLHIKTLANLLEVEELKFHSIIAFIGDCEIKTEDKLPQHVLSSGIIAYIKDKRVELLTSEQVTIIVEQIETHRFAKSWRTNANHKAYLKDKHANKKQSGIKKDSFIEPASLNKSPSNDIIQPRANNSPVNSQTKPQVVDSTMPNAMPNCPKCKSNMVKRVAKTGPRKGQSFWGCTRFPKCRGVVNLN